MTISYTDSFTVLLLRWKGSLYKAVLRDCIIFYVLYYAIMMANLYLLKDKQQAYFTGLIIWFEKGTLYIPLEFLLGFFVAVIVARWWEQFNWISWPDKLMMHVSLYIPGNEHRLIRRTIARWSTLQAAIAWRAISVRTLKRFPTEQHLVDAGMMTKSEYEQYMSINAPHGKWFLPVLWILNLLKKCRDDGIYGSYELKQLTKHVMIFRDGFAMLFVYDWVKIPLVYTQVVAIATYGYFALCLIGRQPKLDSKSRESEVTLYFPIFTTLQMLFYFGWLKVGQFLMNPFGEDDDDFELNYILDRNTQVAYMIADDLHGQMPEVEQDAFIERRPIQLPHTRASMRRQDVVPRGHLSDFKLSEDEMQLVSPDEEQQLFAERAQRRGPRAWRAVTQQLQQRRRSVGLRSTSSGARGEAMELKSDAANDVAQSIA